MPCNYAAKGFPKSTPTRGRRHTMTEASATVVAGPVERAAPDPTKAAEQRDY